MNDIKELYKIINAEIESGILSDDEESAFDSYERLISIESGEIPLKGERDKKRLIL